MPTLCNHTNDRDSPGVLYEQQWVKDQIGKIQGFIRAHIAWLGIASSIGQRVLDYACGHGTISLASEKALSYYCEADNDNRLWQTNARIQYSAASTRIRSK
jgi:hypothetical protein